MEPNMDDLLDKLRRFTSRNEFATTVEVTAGNKTELEELAREHDGLYVDFVKKPGGHYDATITLDLDEMHGT